MQLGSFSQNLTKSRICVKITGGSWVHIPKDFCGQSHTYLTLLPTPIGPQKAKNDPNLKVMIKGNVENKSCRAL